MRLHSFEESLEVEARYAPLIDRWLREQGYEVRAATMDEQWSGIDRVVTGPDGQARPVEYKVDQVAARTGRLFVETVSNHKSGRAGWAYTTQAQWIFYLVVGDRLLRILPERLRALLPGWLRLFPLRSADNGTYKTVGVCVPLAAAAQVADLVVPFPEGTCPTTIPGD